jgi:hypothetical protein
VEEMRKRKTYTRACSPHLLLVEMEGSLLIRWVALYALAIIWRRGERGKHIRALAHLAEVR